MDPSAIIKRGPQIFVGVGVLMLLLAAYIAGSERMTCQRAGERVDCHVRRDRLLGLLTVERVDATDVVDAFVRTTTDRAGSQSSRSAYTRTSSNDTLVLKTRGGMEVDSLGGEESFAYTERLEPLLKNQSTAVVTLVDSMWIMAGACGGFALVFLAFGLIAWRVGG